jgi:hypothetical protein
MKLAGDASCFSNPQHQLCYTFELLMGLAFTQVETYILDSDVNLTDIPVLITILETAFGDPDSIAIVERKLEVLKQINHDFSTYYVKFQCYATDFQ